MEETETLELQVDRNWNFDGYLGVLKFGEEEKTLVFLELQGGRKAANIVF